MTRRNIARIEVSLENIDRDAPQMRWGELTNPQFLAVFDFDKLSQEDRIKVIEAGMNLLYPRPTELSDIGLPAETVEGGSETAPDGWMMAVDWLANPVTVSVFSTLHLIPEAKGDLGIAYCGAKSVKRWSWSKTAKRDNFFKCPVCFNPDNLGGPFHTQIETARSRTVQEATNHQPMTADCYSLDTVIQVVKFLREQAVRNAVDYVVSQGFRRVVAEQVVWTVAQMQKMDCACPRCYQSDRFLVSASIHDPITLCNHCGWVSGEPAVDGKGSGG